MQWAQKQKGFTIVELLIVVVVVAILASVTVVGFNTIRERADSSAVATNLAQAAKKVREYAIVNSDVYPSTLVEAGVGNATSFFYSADNATSPRSFCIEYTQKDRTYFITRRSADPTEGSCRGMVAWWPLNGIGNDVVAGVANGTIAGAPVPTVGQNGQPDSAYEFTTNGHRFNLTPGWGAGISFAEMSGSAWVKLNSNTGTQGIIWSGSGAFHWELVNNSWRVRISGLDRTSLAPGPTVGEWAHVAFTHNRATNSFAYYINGVQVHTSTGNSGSNTYFTPASGDLGGSLNGSRQWFGSLDDIRLYNRELSASDVSELYRLGAQ